jgi:predicted nuclease of predicted toxin-antitoxin system
MNLSPSWVGFLADRGIVAVHWSTLGAANAPDTELMQWARTHGHVVFTNDLDFGVLIALAGASGPSVLQIRSLDLLPSAIGERVAALITRCADDLARGAIVVLTGETDRVRLLPIGRS